MKTPKKIMRAARGQACTLAIPNVCNHNPETVVFCHHSDGTGGSNTLSGPLSGGFGCSSCHSEIDMRTFKGTTQQDLEFYKRRSMIRTINKLIEMGLVKL
jgi:hypothetical protein